MKHLLNTVLTVAIYAASISLLGLVGCKGVTSVGVKGKGLYANVNTGTIGAGYFKVTTTPKGEESAYIEYSEDTALLSPSTKTHYIEANLNGTNAVSQVGTIVTAICDAYISTKTPTNAASQVTLITDPAAVSNILNSARSATLQPSNLQPPTSL